MTTEIYRTIPDGLYRFICHEDNLDETFTSRQDFIDRLVKANEHYQLHDHKKNELLKSFEHGWLALDNYQVVKEVESIIFEEEQEAKSDSRHNTSLLSPQAWGR